MHTTYQFSQARKRQRLREAGLWLLDDDAYFGKGPGFTKNGFIAMLPDDQPPAELIRDGAGVEKHLAAASWVSTLAIRNLVAAAARRRSRVPVLPRITCVCDRWWGNVLPVVQIPGSDVSPPFGTCPQDHIMNLPNMERAGVDGASGAFWIASGMGARRWRVWGGVPRGCRRGCRQIGGSFARVVDLPAYPTDAEWAKATAELDETRSCTQNNVSSFSRLPSSAEAAAFDRKMAVALQADLALLRVGGGCGRGG